MTKHTRLYLWVFIILVVIVSIIAMIKPMRLVPACHEDVALIGYGSFENGRWTDYACGPALDDLIEWRENSD